LEKFKLSKQSISKLDGVHPELVKVVHRAIELTDCDFRVLEGVRTKERQTRLVAAGASKTMNSKHLTGHAVDLAAIIDGQVRWDWPLYHQIAQAMRAAAIELSVGIIWGGVWDTPLNKIVDTEREMAEYAARMKAQGIKPLLDGPHFQLA